MGENRMKICCKCAIPGHQGLNGKWYCDEHFVQLKRDDSIDWKLIALDGKQRRQERETKNV